MKLQNHKGVSAILKLKNQRGRFHNTEKCLQPVGGLALLFPARYITSRKEQQGPCNNQRSYVDCNSCRNNKQTQQKKQQKAML
jgi:hypothetical protein